jgi:hypothetical protein
VKDWARRDPPVIIVSPDYRRLPIREALRRRRRRFCHPTFAAWNGRCSFDAHRVMSDFTGMSLVVWSTQPVIRPKHLARTAKLGTVVRLLRHGPSDCFRRTSLRAHSTQHIRRGSNPRPETHLGKCRKQPSFGETNIGMFMLKNQTNVRVLARTAKSLLG